MSWLIRAQADDFFAAYQVLTKSGPLMGGPTVVNLAFALELYIKDLHVTLYDKKNKNRVKAPRGHNILDLFRKLPPNAQQEIRNYPAIQKLVAFYSIQSPFYIPQDKNNQPITDVLEQEIYKISDAFQKWRYSYEGRALKYEENTALTLIEAIKFTADIARKNDARLSRLL